MGVGGRQFSVGKGANAAPAAASVTGPQPPAKQVCDIVPPVPLRGPGEQASGTLAGDRVLQETKGGEVCP